MDNGILLKFEKIVILFGVGEIAIILFDDRLFVITLNFIRGGMHLVVYESLPLKEVLPPLLLLNELLRLAIALLQLSLQALFEFLDQTHNLFE